MLSGRLKLTNMDSRDSESVAAIYESKSGLYAALKKLSATVDFDGSPPSILTGSQTLPAKAADLDIAEDQAIYQSFLNWDATAMPRDGGEPPPGGDDADSVKDIDYGRVDLSPTTSVTIYESSRNEAYRKLGTIAKLRFYYSPPMTIDRSTVQVFAVDGKIYCRFQALMHHPAIQQLVLRYIRDRENNLNIAANQIDIIPINRLRVIPRYGAYSRARYFYPSFDQPFFGRPIFNQSHWVEFKLETQGQADAMKQDITSGAAAFDIIAHFSGKVTNTDITAIKISASETQSIFNNLQGTGGAGYVSRAQVTTALGEFLQRYEEYVYQESGSQETLRADGLLALIQNRTLPRSEVAIGSFTTELWQRMSEYHFNRDDIKPEQVTKITTDISSSSDYRVANSQKIGGSAQAGFLGFTGSVSGNYETQNEYQLKMNNSFKGEWQGSRFIPSSLSIYELNSVNVKGETILANIRSIVRPGEGRTQQQRNASDGWDMNVDKYIIREATWALGTQPFSQNAVVGNLTHSGCASVALYFSKFTTEQNYDYIELLDDQGKQVAKYSGALGPFWTPEIPGTKVVIRFVSDGSVDKTDIAFTQIRYRV